LENSNLKYCWKFFPKIIRNSHKNENINNEENLIKIDTLKISNSKIEENIYDENDLIKN